MSLLRALLLAIEIPAGAAGVRQRGLPAPPARRVSPREDRRGPGILPSVPRQSAEVARPPSGLLAAVSRAAPHDRSAESRATAPSGPETSAARSCKQQLSFGPKTFRCRGLAAGTQPAESCKQQPSSGASLDFGSTSAPETTRVAVLQTTTSWRPGGFDRITEVALCSPPIRSTTCIACIGPSGGPSAR